MTVLSVCNHKGGTGKTTTAIHISAALGLSGRSILVIDLDPQGFLTRAMGFGEPAPSQSVAGFFESKHDPQHIDPKSTQGFDLIPSSSVLTRRMRDLNKPTDVLWVREVLQTIDLDYDVVLFDTAAALTVYSLNALVASEHVVIPVLPEYQSIVGGEQTYQTVQLVEDKLNPLLQSPHFVFTQVDARKRMHQTYREYIREKYGRLVLENEIRTSSSLAKSQNGRTTVFDRDPNARGAVDYANVTDELVGRMQAGAEVDEPVPEDLRTSAQAASKNASDLREILSSQAN